MIGIVVSRADRASEHIGQQLLEIDEWEEHEDADRPDAEGGGTFYRRDGFELRTFEDLHIYLGDPTPAFGGSDVDEGESDGGADEADSAIDMLVFVSRHSGETGALLTAHFTGNFGPAEYGGSDGEMARAAPNAQKQLVERFETHAPERYDVGIECTHHGPSETAVPSLFAELGSGDTQWDDVEGARAVAEAVLGLEGEGPDVVGEEGRPRHVVGFGGGHYVPRFTRIVEETAWGVGHIGADWQLDEMGAPEANRDVLERAFAASAAEYAVVEGDKPDLEATIADLGYRIVGETWVNEVGERPLALVEAVEDAVATVADGLRFGEVVSTVEDAATAREEFVVRELPDDLLAAAQGIDPEAVREAVAATTVAFETEQAGSRATGTAAFTADAAWVTLVEELASVLRGKYDEVTIREDVVVAREEAFDPALAAKWGVPEGPKFGRLASGESVDLDRKTVDPSDVLREQEEHFPLPRSTETAE
ncbi:MAG: D-aminoacyl-tRNA deacylase [Halopenitus sp.]